MKTIKDAIEETKKLISLNEEAFNKLALWMKDKDILVEETIERRIPAFKSNNK